MKAKHLSQVFLLVVFPLLVVFGLTRLASAGGVKPQKPDIVSPPPQIWSNPSAIDAPNDVGKWDSLAIAHDGKIWVSYYDATNNVLKAAKLVGSGGNCGTNNGWFCTVVDHSVGTGQYSSIAINPNDDWPGIAYYSSSDASLRFAQYFDIAGGFWETFTIDISASEWLGWYTSLAYDSSGYEHIAYYRALGGGTNALMYSTHTSGAFGSHNCGPHSTWQCDVIDSGLDVGYGTSLKLGGFDIPAIAYWDGGNDHLRYAVYVTSGGNCGPSNKWSCVTIDSTGSGGSGGYPSMVLDKSYSADYSLGAQIAYYNGVSHTLMYASHVNSGGNCGAGSNSFGTGAGTWQCDVIDTVASTPKPLSSPGQYFSIGADSSNVPYIAYYNATNGTLHLAHRLGIGAGNCGPIFLFYTWTCGIIDVSGPYNGTDYVGAFPSLAFNSAGLLKIAYYDTTPGDLLWIDQRLQTFLPLALKNH